MHLLFLKPFSSSTNRLSSSQQFNLWFRILEYAFQNHRLEADASIVLGILGFIVTFGDGLNYTFAPRGIDNF